MALLQKQNVFLDEIPVILSSLHHYTFQLPSNFLVRNIYIFHSRLQVNDQELWNFNSKSRLKINLHRNPDVTILILNNLLRFVLRNLSDFESFQSFYVLRIIGVRAALSKFVNDLLFQFCLNCQRQKIA